MSCALPETVFKTDVVVPPSPFFGHGASLSLHDPHVAVDGSSTSFHSLSLDLLDDCSLSGLQDHLTPHGTDGKS